MEVESDCKKTASISMTLMNKRIVWPEVRKTPGCVCKIQMKWLFTDRYITHHETLTTKSVIRKQLCISLHTHFHNKLTYILNIYFCISNVKCYKEYPSLFYP